MDVVQSLHKKHTTDINNIAIKLAIYLQKPQSNRVEKVSDNIM